eukprot:356220-Pyramimonas_sp.AAC.1
MVNQLRRHLPSRISGLHAYLLNLETSARRIPDGLRCYSKLANLAVATSPNNVTAVTALRLFRQQSRLASTVGGTNASLNDPQDILNLRWEAAYR